MLIDTISTPIATVNETYSKLFDAAVVQTFLKATSSKKCYAASMVCRIEATAFGVIDSIIECIGKTPDTHYFVDDAGYVTFLDVNHKPELMVNIMLNDNRPFETSRRMVTINFYGAPSIVENAYKAIATKHKTETRPEVTWYCFNGGRTESFSVECSPPMKYTDEFYPWIKGGVDNYFDAFVKSDSNILLLYGEAGCGKTAFIRNLMWRHHLNTMISYDPEMFGQDQFFITFLNSNHQLLVAEDADTLLYSRENERNHVMSKILNASDGLIKIPNKKIIFTANITNLNKVDPALLRPGRCYDVLEFRRMTMAEADAAATSVGVDLPKRSEGYTLAELFNYMTPAGDIKRGQGIGF